MLLCGYTIETVKNKSRLLVYLVYVETTKCPRRSISRRILAKYTWTKPLGHMVNTDKEDKRQSRGPGGRGRPFVG